MNAHDLNAHTFALMREKNITWREARPLLAAHGGAARAANRRRRAETALRAEQAQALAERIAP